MFQSKFNRLIVASIAAAAIAPTAALASPAGDAGGTASETQDFRAPDNQVGGGAPGTGVVQDLRAPDQVAPGTQPGKVLPGPPTWPANPQTIKPAAPTNATSDDGIDDGVLIALGGGALLLVAGMGVAGRKRLQVVRQRQLAYGRIPGDAATGGVPGTRSNCSPLTSHRGTSDAAPTAPDIPAARRAPAGAHASAPGA